MNLLRWLWSLITTCPEYEEGYDYGCRAAYRGEDAVNPFPAGSEQHRGWRAGWRAVMRAW